MFKVLGSWNQSVPFAASSLLQLRDIPQRIRCHFSFETHLHTGADSDRARACRVFNVGYGFSLNLEDTDWVFPPPNRKEGGGGGPTSVRLSCALRTNAYLHVYPLYAPMMHTYMSIYVIFCLWNAYEGNDALSLAPAMGLKAIFTDHSIFGFSGIDAVFFFCSFFFLNVYLGGASHQHHVEVVCYVLV